jgi:predicted DNA-binding transcriptional regulator AlpA
VTAHRVTTQALASAAGVSRSTLHRWVAAGILPPPVRTGDGRGVVALWPAWCVEWIEHTKARRAEGATLPELAAEREDWRQARIPGA